MDPHRKTALVRDTRDAHLGGQIPQALGQAAPDLLAADPDIRTIDLVAVKWLATRAYDQPVLGTHDDGRLARVPDLDLLTTADVDGGDLLTAAESDWSRPIRHCPGWDAAQLVGHMGGILAWMATIVTTGQRVARRDREVAPTDNGELAGWYSHHLHRTLHVLATTDPETATWTFSSRGDQRVTWWWRRLAVELAIHRWDAQHAAGFDGAPPPRPLDGDVAAAGTEEFLTEFLPGLLASKDVEGLTRTLHLHATDGESEWWIDLDARGDAVAVAGHAKADTAVRGTRSDLLLWLTNRAPSHQLEILGRPALATSWTQLRR
jgi:uncharacterized protein (TIGR03083 family)